MATSLDKSIYEPDEFELNPWEDFVDLTDDLAGRGTLISIPSRPENADVVVSANVSQILRDIRLEMRRLAVLVLNAD